MEHKPIDINQRIPLATLAVGLSSFLDDSYSEDYILEQLRLEFKGENRLRKSVRIVSKTILRNPLTDFVVAHKEEIRQAIKKKHDRNVILIALLNSSFTFSFDALQFLGKFLSVQELVNRQALKTALARIYGGNRATDNAIDSVIPMFIEAGLITRPGLAVYELNKELQITSPVTEKVFIESYKANSGLDGLQDYQLRDPYFVFANGLSNLSG